MKHLSLTVHGDVQQVDFRGAAKRKADDLELKGLVKNNSDGTVTIEVEGDNSKVDAFVVWVNTGSPGTVESLDQSIDSVRGLEEFKIEY